MSHLSKCSAYPLAYLCEDLNFFINNRLHKTLKKTYFSDRLFNNTSVSFFLPRRTQRTRRLHRESVFFNNLKILSNLFFYLQVRCAEGGAVRQIVEPVNKKITWNFVLDGVPAQIRFLFYFLCVLCVLRGSNFNGLLFKPLKIKK